MAGMSVSTGMVSGIDYSSMVGQLMQVERNPQTLLRSQLSATRSDAAAYRAVNTRFDALRTAAAALAADATWTSTKAASSIGSVTATAGASAAPGSLTFAVTELSARHSEISDATWSGTGTQFGATSFSVTSAGKTTTVPITTKNPDGPTLADAVTAINASTAGVTATAVRVAEGQYKLQVTATASGAAAAFSVGDDTAFKTVTQGVDAQLSVGDGAGAYTVKSSTNTFSGLMADTTFTVTKKGDTATVSVAKDPDAAAAKVQGLVDAANSLLQSISAYTDADSSSAVLKGDRTLRGLASRILDVVSTGLGGTSANTIGLQLAPKGGSLVFDKTVFAAKLAGDPTAVRDMLTKKTVVNSGTDRIAGNADDVVEPIGISAKLEALARTASDSTTGTLTMLAKSQDASATDLQSRIDAWEIRLAIREKAITRQFTAMETALSTMQNQATWLSGQIAGLPSWSR